MLDDDEGQQILHNIRLLRERFEPAQRTHYSRARFDAALSAIRRASVLLASVVIGTVTIGGVVGMDGTAIPAAVT